jgi:hypothetical protein
MGARPAWNGYVLVDDVDVYGKWKLGAGVERASWQRQAIHRMAVITCALMRPSIGPLPNRCTNASAAFCVASSRRDGSRASISFLSGVPWQ